MGPLTLLKFALIIHTKRRWEEKLEAVIVAGLTVKFYLGNVEVQVQVYHM